MPSSPARFSPDDRSLSVHVDEATLGGLPGGQAGQLNVLYRYEDGKGYKRQDVATAFSNASEEGARLLIIKPKTDDKGKLLDSGRLFIERAKYGPIPSATTPVGSSPASCACSSPRFRPAQASVCGWH